MNREAIHARRSVLYIQKLSVRKQWRSLDKEVIGNFNFGEHGRRLKQ
jgi:hypothetical protein